MSPQKQCHICPIVLAPVFGFEQHQEMRAYTHHLHHPKSVGMKPEPILQDGLLLGTFAEALWEKLRTRKVYYSLV